MFSLSSEKNINTDYPLIVGGNQVLHFDEAPVLFSGVNRLGTRVIGSLIQNDYSNNKDYFFHVIVDDGAYAAFINQKLTYRDVLASARPVFIVEKNLESDEVAIYHYSLTDIPVEWLPTTLSYCPEQEMEPTFIYPVSLVGGLADLHRILPETAGKTQNLIAGFLRSPLKPLRKLKDINTEVYLQALPGKSEIAYAGSFKVNYNISVDPQQLSLFAKPQDYLSFLNAYISYCLSSLPSDAVALSEHNTTNLSKFNLLLEKYESLVGVSQRSKESVRDGFIGDVLKTASSLNAISDTIGEEYSQIVLANLSDGGEHPLGVINQDYREEMQIALIKVDEGAGKTIVKDSEPRPYKIYIYDLNTDSRKGRALVEHPIEMDRFMKPTIKIDNVEQIAGTKYTESLHLDKYIDVRGKGIHVDGILKNIDIVFER